MKKFISLFLLLILALAVVGCKGPVVEDVDTTLIMGTTTDAGPNMFGTFWGNNASNADVRRLTFGYATVSYQKEAAKYEVDDTVVKSLNTVENQDGSKTYTIEINEGLVWNDGEPVTAKDYVFALLLAINPTFAEAGGFTASTTGVLVGSKDYVDPEKNTDGKAELPGVDFLSDYKFSVQIGAENFPYFYEFLYYQVTPYPLHTIAPEADIAQGDNGAKITGVFTKDSLQATVDKDGKGYRYDISVTCGAYSLYDYDETNFTVTLKRNEKYAGNYNGDKPDIDNIIIKSVQSDVLLQSLVNGEIDLIAQVSGGTNIQSGLTEVANNKINYTTFSRNGYGLIAFHCDEVAGPTSSVAVRQAIAYLINRDLFLQTYTLGYGVLPNGEYGLAQWMVAASMNDDGVVLGKNEAGELVPLNNYSYNPEKAVELLEADGWIYGDEAGTVLFDESLHTVRYKKLTDGTVVKLEIPWGNSANNPVSELIRTQLLPNAAAVGMSITDNTMDFNTLLYRHYYGMYGDGYLAPEQDENGNWVVPEYEKKNESNEVIEADAREYHMVNLGTGFETGLFEPYYEVSLEYWGWDGGANVNYIYDEAMLDAAEDMMRSDTDAKYLEAWQRFQYRYNYLLPTLPLYSDLYHSFFSKNLKDYEVTAEWLWTDAVIYAKMETAK